jgi:cytochrome c biogenesis protein CcmG, thiol:disulfide interchange protein DsbE
MGPVAPMKKYVPILLFIMAFSGFLSTQILWDTFNLNAELVGQDKQKHSIYETNLQTLKLTTTKGTTVELRNETTPIILLNFWASWCGPCELEAPDLQRIHEKYGDAIQLYGINATKYDKERAAREFVNEYEFTFPILMDRVGDVTKQYKVDTFPTSFLIDSNGVIRERINGVITFEEWERLIEKWM